MDKQEAVVFIKEHLQNNRTPDEITSLLSQELGAPPQVVSKFVAQVAAQVAFAPTSADFAPTPTPSSPIEQAEENKPEPTPLAEVKSALSPRPAAQAIPQSSRPAGRPQIDPDTQALVLEALLKNKNQEDIIMTLCERDNMTWGDAQRLVAQVRIQNQKQLGRRKNMILLPLIIAAILGGIVVTWGSVSEIINGYFDRDMLYSLSIGGVLLLGGIAGLVSFLMNPGNN